jgi:hypothetical protein
MAPPPGSGYNLVMTSPLVLGPMMRYVDETSASIWMETRSAAQVTVRAGGRDWSARTFAVHGHHYALVEVTGLGPGTVTAYTLEVDGTQVWPDPESGFPASKIATLAPGRPLRLAFGSCRTSIPHDAAGNRSHGVDSLRAYALQMASGDGTSWPDLVAFLGDQVYADSTSKLMQEFIRSRRDIRKPPGKELKDYEEYAHLYYLAWSDPANRWLLSTLPSTMIFDDHDIRDDWNASLTWKREMAATPWWHERVVSGLASYWVYQHLGNLSPQERGQDALWQQVVRHSGHNELDLSAELDHLVERADASPETYRWSLCRDFGDTRLLVVDSRAARELSPDRRALLDDVEMAWLDDSMRGGFRHLLIATSLPFLLPMGLNHVESWNEAIAEGAWGRLPAKAAEKLRQALDLEHWAAFQNSFQRLSHMAGEVADGKRGDAPETIMFLSGDVHFSYVAEVQRTAGSRIIQAVCSPIRNPLPRVMRFVTAISSYGLAASLGALAARSAKVPDPPFKWSGIKGPWFDNNLASLEVTDEGMNLWWQKGVVKGGDQLHPRLERVASLTITPRNITPSNVGQPAP